MFQNDRGSPTQVMHNYYIINEAVEFHPATSTLRDIHNPDVVVTLNSPAGRCLLLLISRVGTIVTQHEFMDIVWKQSGMRVTSNAYYQNISVLRKGLKRIGLGEDIIVTIPRIGLTLATGTSIRKLTAETAKDTSHEMARSAGIAAAASEALVEESYNVGDENRTDKLHLMEIIPAQSVSSGSNKINKVYRNRYLLVMLTIISAFIFMAFYGFIKLKPDYFADYISAKSIKGCEILLSQPLAGKSDQGHAQGFGERFIHDCQSYPWIYVTRIPNLSRTSVIRCDKPFQKSTSCISEYFIE
ncbi:winged helix-turn-helix domain-containing protein [Dryocola sp. BD613]|uniref:winged helix-turn-helix domain-containing protein n=1 Tax=Dryocola sp. BD613 TaxID=3133272 RepID=UPI003F50D0BD